jgi:hypothetical protein
VLEVVLLFYLPLVLLLLPLSDFCLCLSSASIFAAYTFASVIAAAAAGVAFSGQAFLAVSSCWCMVPNKGVCVCVCVRARVCV